MGPVRRWQFGLILALASCFRTPQLCNVVCDENGGAACPNGGVCSAGVCMNAETNTCMVQGDGGGDDDGGGIDAAPLCGMATTASFGVGARHACELDDKGDVFCWGAGDAGGDAARPKRVGDCWTALAVGANHSCAIDSAGDAYCWGDNRAGQVDGDASGATPSYATPTKVAGTHGKFTAIAAGGEHTCAIAEGGVMSCWGATEVVGGTTGAMAAVAGQWATISLGTEQGCGMLVGGGVECFGNNANGEVDPTGLPVTLGPTVVAVAGAVTSASAGDGMSCAIADGGLFCWGLAARLDPVGGSGSVNQQVGSGTGWSAVRIGHAVSCGVEDGKLVCWGHAEHGGLANGLWAAADVRAVDAVEGVAGVGAVDVAVAAPGAAPVVSEHACAVIDGKLECWGQNEVGELGIGAASHAESPVKAKNGQHEWSALVAAGGHACAIDSADFSLSCWGENDGGQVDATPAGGAGAPCLKGGHACDFPQPVAAPIAAGAVGDVVAGTDFTCALQGDVVSCWGDNTNGTLGNGGTTGNGPVQIVSGTKKWKALTGGDSVACAQSTAGADSTFCWGGCRMGGRTSSRRGS